MLLVVGVRGELYFSGKFADGGLLMVDGVPVQGETRTLKAGESVIWISKAMKADTTFSDGEWKVGYWASSPGIHRIYVSIYKFDGELIPIAEGYNVLSCTNPCEKSKSFEIDSLTLKKGERIAVEIKWSGAAKSDLTLYFNSSEHPSALEVPAVLNQIPEFSSTALLFVSIIIVCLSRFMVRRGS
jgi:hypothetical protein